MSQPRQQQYQNRQDPKVQRVRLLQNVAASGQSENPFEYANGLVDAKRRQQYLQERTQNTKSVPLILAESTTLNLFHWNRSDEMMMIVLEASETKFSLPQHKKGSNTQRLDVEIPRKKAPNCKGSPSISQMKDFEFESS